MLFHATPTMLDRVWKDAAVLLSASVTRTHGEFDLSQAQLLVRGGYMHLLGWKDGEELVSAALVEFVDYPCYRALRVVLYAGKFTCEQQQALVNWANANGASKLELWADAGVRRLFQRRGFEDTYTVMRMDI